MNEPFRNEPGANDPGAEPTTVLPETAAQLVEMERLQQALVQAEERAKRTTGSSTSGRWRISRTSASAPRNDIEAAHRYGIDKLAAELLPVRDSLELAVENADKADAQQLTAGSQATLKLLSRVFDKLNITELNPLGEPFDPARHEAMLAQPSTTAEPNSVLQGGAAGL